ncbi:putative cleavage and polyadenylation specificity factor subunit 4 [Monocercomonoides exilis]|uniref:putative cleavage and polyadenylation specificity factor subunit 4 n=1 Tax=Monocercomonoides exilis TaxID=2049356 RepID=UPI00355A96CE|nr:putative cleavage and polyadenylation specificity factor subunit 4 [Monocercomonoides exilis]|eukprot:MONOS_3525.1-p1 / transcript=MONOS_3525.1 / gene=MONOS_3525 / organism=Monocercomonoides_exilis_PA203 / gene_product=cleavage and polyadenylation specificity factor subunit 4 / transcript_product=cleavage and polyadenylation specificity factor subunit 4 / location=Mono_scaffold00083:102773-103656(+) / protein_length=216 / sequence_SO=supercontig / SO=protein_coding / is_pseudo=false
MEVSLQSLFPVTDVENDIKRSLFDDNGKSRRGEVCALHLAGHCPRENKCPYKHLPSSKKVVCKHWFKGLCMKGNQCDFLHVYDLTLMPECKFFARDGKCTKEGCPFRHIKPEEKQKECAWYKRGFCRRGPLCKNLHIRKQACPLYLAGFCPDGPTCSFSHIRFDNPRGDDENAEFEKKMSEAMGLIGVITTKRRGDSIDGGRTEGNSGSEKRRRMG